MAILPLLVGLFLPGLGDSLSILSSPSNQTRQLGQTVSFLCEVRDIGQLYLITSMYLYHAFRKRLNIVRIACIIAYMQYA